MNIGTPMFRKALREAIAKIPFDKITRNTYAAHIQLNMGTFDNVFIDYYERIGLLHGNRVGKELNKEINKKNFDPSSFKGEYRDFIRQWLLNNGGQRIVSIRQNLVEKIIQFIAAKLEEGNDIRTITRDLEKLMKSRGFYRYEIERIVRTETTAAANQGAIRAGHSSRVIWEKVWISSKDSRTRRRPEDEFDHYDIDGQRVARNEKFNVQGDFLDHPGDPRGHPANTINCRCTVAVVAKRDENGRIIFRDSTQLVQ